jgi:hypothetical protein
VDDYGNPAPFTNLPAFGFFAFYSPLGAFAEFNSPVAQTYIADGLDEFDQSAIDDPVNFSASPFTLSDEPTPNSLLGAQDAETAFDHPAVLSLLPGHTSTTAVNPANPASTTASTMANSVGLPTFTMTDPAGYQVDIDPELETAQAKSVGQLRKVEEVRCILTFVYSR